jgi:hypothetical protein
MEGVIMTLGSLINDTERKLSLCYVVPLALIYRDVAWYVINKLCDKLYIKPPDCSDLLLSTMNIL